jgi:formate dehydrogenase subunit gamma
MNKSTTAATGLPRPSSSTIRLLRFDRVQRTAHWANALLFGILMATALPLYFGSIGDIIGRRHLVAQVHLWAGIALPFPLIASLVGPWGSRMRADLRRINRWTREEMRWLRTLGRATTPLDKFNPGQKLNAIFTGGVILIMLATGSMLQWFRFFPVPWRTGATFVHDCFAFAIFFVVFGHIAFAIGHRESLRSMVKGWVTDKWAASHAEAWWRELGAPAGPREASKAPMR